MSGIRQHIDQMRAMGELPYEARLENEVSRLRAENAQLKARLAESDRAYYDAAGTIDHLKERLAYQDRWLSGGVYYTNEEATALHKKHNEEVAQLKAELAQAKLRLDKWERVEMLDKELFSIAPADLTAEFYHNAANAARQMDEQLKQAKAREARLRALLREAVQCFCVTQKPADYPVDSWINKALAELCRPEEAGT